MQATSTQAAPPQAMTLPPSLPLPSFLQSWLWFSRPIALLNFGQRRYGHAFRIKLPGVDIAFFSDPDSIRTIFAGKSDETSGAQYNRINLRAAYGESSLPVIDGDEHMRHRRLLMPPLHGERMRHYGNTMAAITHDAIATWQEDTPFSLHEHTQEISLKIIYHTLFGGDEDRQLRELDASVRSMLLRPALSSVLVMPTMMYLSKEPSRGTQIPFRWMLKARTETIALLDRQVAARRAQLLADAESARTRTDLLSMLVQARDEDGQPMTDSEVRDELLGMLLAGQETTATALAWAVERIVSTPEVHARLRAEIHEAGGLSATPERIAALPYLDATIKEVLRCRPVLPAVGRVLQRPQVIGGYAMPAGSIAAACIYLAHQNPAVYPDPEAFRPERFTTGQPNPTTWLPFGGGIRRCIGAQFAMYEMKIVIYTMFAACDISAARPKPAKVIRRAVTFWPEGGAVVRVKRRGAPVLAAAE